jgi:hypothetical protein
MSTPRHAGPERTAAKLPSYSSLGEPLLVFAGGRHDTHPLRGLRDAGPYSRDAVAAYTPVVRVATVGPRSGQRHVRDLLGSLRQKHNPGDRAEYVPEFPGFGQLLGPDLNLADNSAAHVTWPDDLGDLEPSGKEASRRIAAALAAAMRRLDLVRESFDVAVVHLPEAWAHACRTDAFDAHDELKALGAIAAIPTQVVNDRAFTFAYRASRAWRLSIALYVKAGGVPWKLAPLPGVPSASAYIGLAYALRGDPRDALFVTCCSQVFDADGGGMQFVAYDARDPIDDGEAARRNPYLSRDDMRAVLARSLRVYQARNGGNVPARVVIHKTTGFRPDEVLGATDALEGIHEVDCFEITTDVAWRAVWLDVPRRPNQRSEPGGYPVRRGTMLPVSGVAALLWSAGDAPSVSTSGHYYQGGKSIPRPVLLTRYAGCGPLEIPALETLALTKMDWNNDALYDTVPVTIRYSQLLARTIARAPWLRRNEYPFRLFM